MNRQNRENLDRAAAQVSATQPDPEEVRRAAERVWARLSAEIGAPAAATTAAPTSAITGCADVQASIPALLSGELPAARRLLIEDHTRECVPCRRALIAARTGRPAHTAAPRPAARAAASPRWRMALAASLVALVGVAGWFATDGLFAGEVATLAQADGLVLGLDGSTEGGVAPLAIGTMIDSGRSFRTGKGSTAVVRLEDGSEVEVAPRTQLSIRERRRGTIIRVDRGAVIVEAADQRSKHLYVETADARVSVTGTIFSVEHGVRGSRVGVVEGEVRVDAGGREVVLHPGDQTTSRASLTAVPVARQVAWSRNFDRYVALLEELAGLRRELADRLPPAESRYDSSLAPLVPADTFAFVALPNLTTTISESWAVFRERLAVSPTLAEWWGERVAAGDAGEIDDAIARLTALGGHLGDEVVVALPNDEGDGGPDGLLLLAEVARPDAFAAAVEAEIARLAAEHEGGHGAGVFLVRDLAELTGGESGLIVWVGAGGVMAASDSPDRLAAVAAALAAGGSGFAATELGQAVERAYADGTQWLLAVDLGAAVEGEAASDPELAATGFADVDRLVVEYWDEGTRSVMSAELGFTGERRGIASWLAAPAPMGTLDFVSADAHAAAAFVVKEPSAMLEDLFAIAGSDDPELARLEDEIGLSLADDVAAPLGGEVAFALDGPFLPEPAWKVVLEVYDPARLEHTIGVAVARLNDELRKEGKQGVTLSSEEDGGRTWHRIDSQYAGFSWVYVDGYLVAAPSKALLERTLDQRAAGATLPASGRFRELLPADVRADFSALLYQNVGPLLAPVAGGLSSLGEGTMTDSQRETLEALIREARPTVAYAYGEPDRVIFAGTGPGGPFGLGFQALSGFGGLAMFGDVLEDAAEQQAPEGG
ncbi:MAG TPA: FecR domain-containing protein [Thermoanaerobaculia bacterium]